MRKALIGILMLWLTGCASWFGTPDTISVDRGDTLYSISKRHDVSLRELIDVNNLRPPYTLKVGQVLRLPASVYHTVSRGDTLYNISRRYNIDVAELKRINAIEPPYTLTIGQKIALNANVPAPAPTRYRAPTPQKRYTVRPAPRKTTYKKPQQSYSVVQNRTAKFLWPVQGRVISKFGTIGKGRANDGINIKAARGTTVRAADSGTVAYAGNELKGFGNLILIRHNDGWITAYAHNDRLAVRKGQRVRRGERIASVGATGGVNTPQLHFEIRAGKKAVNPTRYLP